VITRKTPISGAFVIESKPQHDTRGAFNRFFCENKLIQILGKRKIVQINHSITSEIGAVRGMHFQCKPYAEMKLVRCIRGRVFDVLVDLRADSPTFLKWHSEELDPLNAQMIVIPEGCAHGFQALEANSELVYLHTNFYTPQSEAGIRYDDQKVGISWPLKVTDLSERDKSHPLLARDFIGFEI
jgi:dTDP-4-dehydrorhamnose 3,5-epimerase